MKGPDNLDAPPSPAFYDLPPGQKPRKRRGSFVAQRKEYWARIRKAYAEQMALPAHQRIGKLRTMKTGDFSEAELAAIRRGK